MSDTAVSSSAQILEAALQLPHDERAQLIEGILLSFEPENRKRIDLLWALEAEDRIDAYERGELKSVPAEAVLADLIPRPVIELGGSRRSVAGDVRQDVVLEDLGTDRLSELDTASNSTGEG